MENINAVQVLPINGFEVGESYVLFIPAYKPGKAAGDQEARMWAAEMEARKMEIHSIFKKHGVFVDIIIGSPDVWKIVKKNIDNSTGETQ